MVEQGKIPRGSYLFIENLDRLTREHIRPALTLLLNLIEHGIRVVQLKPVEQVFTEDVEMFRLMLAIMELSRGNNESRIKSERMAEVWGARRRALRDSCMIMTRMTPAWVEERDGKLVLIPERARVVRRIFALAIGGYGLGLIVRELTRDGVPTWGEGSKGWTKSYVHKILAGRTVLGE
jgi:DNA invertase Pin-like site-specific DNA recombinase